MSLRVRLVSAFLVLLVVGCDPMSLASPDASVDLTARLQAPGRPLILVDGSPIPAGFDLRSLLQADIVSIEVVKNAAATGIYGPAASAGVIHITTRNHR
jgi:TonB-dependent SusC/RagA subfamily outer membrane receptor